VTTDATKSHTEISKIPESEDEHFTINLSTEAFELYNIEDPPSLSMDVTKRELRKMYQDMVVIRRMELASDALYKAKKIRGLYVSQCIPRLIVVGVIVDRLTANFSHLSTGQEAVAVGIEHAITKEDNVLFPLTLH